MSEGRYAVIRNAVMGALAVMLALAVGCAPFESYKQLNDQQKQIGAKIKLSPDPLVAQMGADVEANSQVLEDVLDLKPETSVPYTPDASAALRKQAKDDHDSPWYMKTWVWLTGAGSVILGLLLTGVKMYFGGAGGPVAALAEDGVAALLDLFQQHSGQAPTSILTKDSLAKIIGDLRADEKYGSLVDDILKKYHLDSQFPKTEPLT